MPARTHKHAQAALPLSNRHFGDLADFDNFCVYPIELKFDGKLDIIIIDVDARMLYLLYAAYKSNCNSNYICNLTYFILCGDYDLPTVCRDLHPKLGVSSSYS